MRRCQPTSQPLWTEVDSSADSASFTGINTIDQIAVHPRNGDLMLMAIVSGDTYFGNALIKTEVAGPADEGTPQQVLIWADPTGNQVFNKVHSKSRITNLSDNQYYEAPAFSEMVFTSPQVTHDVDYLSYYDGPESVMSVIERFND